MEAARRGALLAALALATARPALAQNPTGAAFLKTTPSTRSYALGMSHGITALGAQALGANPANIGLMSVGYEAFTSYATLMGGLQYEHLAAASRFSQLGPIDGFGVSLTRQQIAGLQGADASGNPTGSSYASSDLAIAIAASARLGSSLRLGAAAKTVQSQIAGFRSNAALAGDFGLTWTTGGFDRPFSIGASLTNAGTGLRFLGQTDPLPTALNLGVAAPFGPAMAVVEVNRGLVDRQVQVGTGLELNLGPVFFRAGFLARSDAGNLALKDNSAGTLLGGLAGGLGLHLGALRLDYAISQQAVEFGTTQRVAVTLRFGAAQAATASPSRSEDGWLDHPDRSDWMIRAMGTY